DSIGIELKNMVDVFENVNLSVRLERSENYFFASNEDSGLYVLDLEDPINPQIVGHLETEMEFTGITIADDIAYMAEADRNQYGIRTIDISNPEDPQTLSQNIQECYYSGTMFKDGDRCYTSQDSVGNSGIFDVSDPENIVYLGQISTEGLVEGLIDLKLYGVYNDHLYYQSYVAHEHWVKGPIIIIDASDPVDIRHVGQCHIDVSVLGKSFEVSGSNAFVKISGDEERNTPGGLGVLDLSDPADPVLVGYIDVPFEINAITPEEETVIVAGPGIGIYDCSEALDFDFPPSFTNAPPETLEIPQYGTEVNFEFTGWDRKGDAVSFSMNWEGENPGAELTDLENGTGEFHWTPREEDIGWHTAQFVISDGALTDTTATVFAVGNVQSVETETVPPSSMSLLEVYPNPFNSMTTIHYTTPNTSEVKLTIYDVVGRQIADLFVGTVESGGHSFVFDGSGFESGVYVVRMTNGGNDKYEKILLVK
ncbi:MAG: T9SS type A sorting domain-containing protein, partial [Calditrichaeota bacterium]|nr:T9SS type A sorting domain-containing protein [Calditrichota bacterium]